jgi:hypothetical protein
MRRVLAVLAATAVTCGLTTAGTAQPAPVSFAEKIDVAVGSGPFDLVAADFNRDQNADVAVANSDSGDVSVLFGNGDGSFVDPGPFSVGDFPIAIAAGLITNDVNPDIAVANEGSQDVSVLAGTGSSFAGPTNTDPAGAPAGIVLADFNGDTRLDVATSELFDDAVTVQLGNRDATGTFGSARSFTVLGSPFGIAAGDLDGDLDVDIVVTASDFSVVVVLSGNGDGTFEVPDCSSDPLPSGCLAVGLSPAGVTVGDINDDGDLDIAVANEDSDSVSVLLNNGDGSFQGAVDLDAGLFSFPEAARIADFNADGNMDIVSANSETDEVAVFLQGDDGSFEDAVFFPVSTSPFAVVVADFNNDEMPDIATANVDGNDVSVLLNESAGGCTGDCDRSGGVTVDELVIGVTIALGNEDPSVCPAFDEDDSGSVTVDELVAAVNNALNGCPA